MTQAPCSILASLVVASISLAGLARAEAPRQGETPRRSAFFAATVRLEPGSGAAHNHHQEPEEGHHQQHDEPDGCQHRCPGCCTSTHGPSTFLGQGNSGPEKPPTTPFRSLLAGLDLAPRAETIFHPPRSGR